jgi:hypothetical protein
MAGRTLDIGSGMGSALDIGVQGRTVNLEGGVEITSEYGRLIAFQSTDPEYAEYRDRLTAIRRDPASSSSSPTRSTAFRPTPPNR